MEHIAIDLGGRESQICIRDEKGTLLREKRVPTRSLPDWLKTRPQSRVVLETCAEGFAIADAALSLGHQVRVVPATLVRSLGVGARGVKTDQRDARVLSEVSCRIDLPSVHIPAEESRRRKSMCGMREALIGARTQLVNTVRGYLRTKSQAVRSGGVESFVERAQKLQGMDAPDFVVRILETVKHLNEQIKTADKELAKLAQQDAVCRRMQSVPGVGPVTAVRFVAALDQVGRFESGAQVASYFGLVPGEDSSSERKRRTSITKAGPSRVRWALVQAAWCFRRFAPENDAMKQWAIEVEKRRGRKAAVVALARKLSGVLYAMWRDGTSYQSREKGK